MDGIYLDLGVSSFQLDTKERGFTYREDAPLDMRMDQRQTLTAADIVNTYSEMELYRLIRDYGEEKFAKNIAKHIARKRQEKPIESRPQESWQRSSRRRSRRRYGQVEDIRPSRPSRPYA